MWQPYRTGKPKISELNQEWDYEEDPVVPPVIYMPDPDLSGESERKEQEEKKKTEAKKPENVITPIQHASYKETQDRIQEFIKWERPNTPNHWPGWDDYRETDYDPNRWEGLPWYVGLTCRTKAQRLISGDRENGYYSNNGIDRLEKDGVTAKPYLPYPYYNSPEWSKQWKGVYKSCKGPRGELTAESPEVVRAYPSLPQDFPNVTIGSAEAIGIDAHSCFDRDSRYAAFGANSSDAFDFENVWWGQLQNDCLRRNKDRFDEHARAPMQVASIRSLPKDHDKLIESSAVLPPTAEEKDKKKPRSHTRTAVLIRAWEGYTYTPNDLHVIRSLVTELSLLSGGEYQLYLLVNVKEREADIYNNPQVYQDVLKRVVPRELRDIAVLWTERVCEEWYPKVGDWQVYWMQFMPLQWFSKTHPEFDYVWNWETDARYTGNAYHFLEQIAEFSKRMPRKHLWERSTRFYFPAEHGNYRSFLADTDIEIDKATAAGTLKPVWGPQPAVSTQVPVGPTPPIEEHEDKYAWGVGEEADLITLQPIWDPSHTEWSYRHKIWNFEPGVHPVFGPDDPAAVGFYHPGYSKLPRRVFINTVARFSKRMLHAMHMENLEGRAMQAEMWPATVALHHGLKALYAPHPIWADRQWPGWYLDAIFNTQGENGVARWGQEIDSPYNHDREANFRGWSWYYATGFPGVLYRRFLGWIADDGGVGKLGGKDYEEPGKGVAMGDGNVVGGHGKMCLPGMLLHPVKQVQENAGGRN